MAAIDDESMPPLNITPTSSRPRSRHCTATSSTSRVASSYSSSEPRRSDLRLWQMPVPPQPLVGRRDGERIGRRQPLHLLEERRGGVDPLGHVDEEVEDTITIDRLGHVLQSDYRAGVRGERDEVLAAVVGERLRSEVVAGEEQLLAALVPDREREVAEEVVDAVLAPLAIGVEQQPTIAELSCCLELGASTCRSARPGCRAERRRRSRCRSTGPRVATARRRTPGWRAARRGRGRPSRATTCGFRRDHGWPSPPASDRPRRGGGVPLAG